MKKGSVILMTGLILITAVLWGTAGYLKISGKEAAYGRVTRIETPERTESTEHPAFKKEAYEPVIPEGENIVKEAKIEANGYNDVYTPRKVKDENLNGASYWEGEVNAYPNVLTASYEEAQSIHAIKLGLCPLSVWSARTQTFSVEISEDGENFTEFIASKDYAFHPDTGNEIVLEFEDITFTAIRFVFTGNTGAGSAQVAELALYSR